MPNSFLLLTKQNVCFKEKSEPSLQITNKLLSKTYFLAFLYYFPSWSFTHSRFIVLVLIQHNNHFFCSFSSEINFFVLFCFFYERYHSFPELTPVPLLGQLCHTFYLSLFFSLSHTHTHTQMQAHYVHLEKTRVRCCCCCCCRCSFRSFVYFFQWSLTEEDEWCVLEELDRETKKK